LTAIVASVIIGVDLNLKAAWYESFFNDTLPRVLSNGGVTILLFVFLGGLMTSLSQDGFWHCQLRNSNYLRGIFHANNSFF